MRALIAMSGGVDSSAAAKLTMDEGYDCIGCTMKLFSSEEEQHTSRTCCSLDDVEDARRVCGRLGIPYYVFNYQEEFRRQVIDKFVREYLQGRTPNPCIDCNRYLKFDALMNRALQLGCEKVVTGHYARIERDAETGKYILKKGLDASKDQSYVLYSMIQDELAHTLFPLGAMRKIDVRLLAERNGFVNSHKPDSQDICFVPNGDYAAVIQKLSGREETEGDFLDLQGNVIGRHKGITHYTIGQHKHLGQSFGSKRYVCRIDAETNTVTLGSNEDVCSTDAKAGNMNWIAGQPPSDEFRCKVKLRYKQQEQWAVVKTVDNGNKIIMRFDEPQRAVTPGQAAVLYDDDIVLGGGTLMIGETRSNFDQMIIGISDMMR